MLHLFGANVLIIASNTYYPVDQIPEFWDWIDHQATNGRIKLPVELLEEVLAGSKKEDPLLAWVTAHKDVLRLPETVDPIIVNKVVTEGYAPDLTDDDIEAIGRDPFLIAYALAEIHDRCVVTAEVSAPAKRRQNRRVPDVCGTFNVACQNPFQVYRHSDSVQHGRNRAKLQPSQKTVKTRGPAGSLAARASALAFQVRSFVLREQPVSDSGDSLGPDDSFGVAGAFQRDLLPLGDGGASIAAGAPIALVPSVAGDGGDDSYDVLSTPKLSCSSGPTNGRPHGAAKGLCICPLSLISVSLGNGPERSRARGLCAAEENLFRC